MATDPNSIPDPNFDWEQSLNEPSSSQEVPEKTVAPPPKPRAPEMKEEESPANLGLLLDIPLEITAELGRTRMIINDLLQLGQGSVIELNKLAGEPLEILVNQKLIARGEVVVVNEKFGIRLTDIISPMERIKQLA